MINGKSRSVGSDIAPGFVALVATVGVQELAPFQNILALYPEELKAVMEPLSALIVGATVSTVLVMFVDMPIQRTRTLITRAWVLMIAAALVLVVMTLSFVVRVDSAVDQRSYPVVIGIAGRLHDCNCERDESDEECLRNLGVGRNASIGCWGRWQVVAAEGSIFAAYLTIALTLGGLGGLLRIAQGAKPTDQIPIRDDPPTNLTNGSTVSGETGPGASARELRILFANLDDME